MASTSSNAHNYADGSVIELTLGAAELTPILASSAAHNQLLLLDFSVAWCGPCKMLAPALSQLAMEYRDRVVVAKLDCGATSANEQLAASASVAAYPTLKIYKNGEVVDTVLGANVRAIKQALERHLATLSTTTAQQQQGSAGKNLAVELAHALSKVKANCSSQEEFITASKTLAAYVNNIVTHPMELKYRKIKLSNSKFKERLGSKVGGKECLLVLGFEERVEAMEGVLVMDGGGAGGAVPVEQLSMVLALLNKAIENAESSGVPSTIGSASTSTPPATATTEATTTTGIEAPSAVPPPSTPSAQQLAQMVSEAMNIQQQQQQPPPRRRVVRVTPRQMAKVLEKILMDSGIGGEQ